MLIKLIIQLCKYTVTGCDSYNAGVILGITLTPPQGRIYEFFDGGGGLGSKTAGIFIY